MADDHSQSLLPNRLLASKCLGDQVLFLRNLVLRFNKLNHLTTKIFPLRRYRESTPKVIINVGGLRHEVLSSSVLT